VVLPIVALLVIGCGGTAATSGPAAPTQAAAPTPTPNPHLSAPASVDAVYTALKKAGMVMTANTADVASAARPEPRRRLNITFAGWPLQLSEYSTSAALQAAVPLKTGAKPTAGDAPYTFAGLNILIVFGPRTNGLPAVPDAARAAAAAKLALAADLLLGPLLQRSITPIPMAGVPAPSPAVSPAASP